MVPIEIPLTLGAIILLHLGLILFDHIRKFRQKLKTFRGAFFGTSSSVVDARGGVLLQMAELEQAGLLGNALKPTG